MSVQPMSGAVDRPMGTPQVREKPTIWSRVYSALSILLTVQLLAQFFFAGLGVFTIMHASDAGTSPDLALKDADQYWGLHALNATIMALVMLVLIGASFAARKPWRTTGLTALFVPLILVQAGLAYTPVAAVSAIHLLNALVILTLAVYLVRGNWAFGRSAAG